ncbi:apical endosomal glycoprotein isoform X2 [Carettochelys insculpta]|uniref:apical endosomal glycoprotein isoform X2 n=1 Tax=Carettochelys insculpta TaxID=44489 RepID=UPI003EBF3AD1
MLDFAVSLLASPHSGVQSVFINRCGCAAPKVCDFVCDCRDCSDENQCGYHKESAILGAPFACDFEEGTCGWKDVSTSAYQWVIDRASSSPWGTGPSTDHTRGTNLGWYMATEMRRNTFAIARLRSPVMRQAAATCEIRAWYRLWGPGLNESVQPALWLELTGANETVTLWQSPESSSSAWRELVAYTGRVPGEFQVTLSSRQSSWQLDDVEFRSCGRPLLLSSPCSPGEGRCSRGSCVQLEQLCDGTDDCGDGSDESSANCSSFTACSFEAGWCGWSSAPDSPFWLRNSSLHLAPGAHQPSRDHTTNSRTGFFLYVSTALLNQSTHTARLTSPTFQATTARPCSLIFYSHLDGSATSSLSISYQTNSTTQLVHTRAADRGDYWFRDKVDFNVSESFQIVFTAVTGAGFKGSLALDDLVLSPGCLQAAGNPAIIPRPPSPEPASPCAPEEFACDGGSCISPQLVCDFTANCADGSEELHCGASTFEAGAGDWQDVSVGQLQWVRKTASAASLPGADHTTNTSGSYLGVEVAPGQVVTAARARTPPLGPSGLACSLELHYWLQSDPQGFLALRIVDPSLGTSRVAWHMQGNDSAEWRQVTVPLGARARPFQLELTALVNLRGLMEQSVAVDDIVFVNCDPSFTPPDASELSCNFERGLCGWYQDQSDDFEWVRSTGPGPVLDSDHTTGTGFFLSVDLAGQSTPGLSARLLTYPQDPPRTEQCLSFWYRLDGPQSGTLNLKIQHDGEPETVLWTRTGAHGSMWHLGFATLRPQALQRYQLIFEALRHGFLGRVALDDVTLRADACGPQESCSFEANACGLSSSWQYAWARKSNATNTAAAGPAADHTVGTAQGYYMIVDTSRDSLPPGQAATLSSGQYRPLTAPQCLSFWYQLGPGEPGSLTLHVEENGLQRRLFSVSSVQGDAWRQGRVTVPATGAWKVVFEAVGAGGELSYIALDDVHLTASSCPNPGSCDFESDTCGWTSPSDPTLGSYAWGWTSAASPGPEVDHTLGTPAGRYVYIETGGLAPRGQPAWLLSEHLPATAGACLRFWYHTDFPESSYGSELRVQLSSTAGQLLVWRTPGRQGHGWQSGTVPVHSTAEFQILFEVTNGAGPAGGTVALDDITYRAGEDCYADGLGQVTDGNPPKGPAAALVIGVVLALVFLLLLAASTCYWLQRRGAAGRKLEERDTSQGFDNVVFRDDTITITPLPGDGDADPAVSLPQ